MSRIINIVARGKSAKGDDWVEPATGPTQRVEGFSAFEAVPEPTARPQLSVEQLIERRLIALDDASEPGRELRKLRAQLLQHMHEQHLHVLGITSPSAGSGRAFFAANLAAAMAAEGGQRVTLIDMDMRAPKLHDYFGVEPAVGIREVLERRTSPTAALQSTGLEQLRVLTGGAHGNLEPERFYNRELSELMPALLELDNNHIIVVRLPPVLDSTETQTYMPAMDCSICVLKEGVNTPQQVEETVAVLKQKAFMGVIFNRAAQFGL